jgi:hypothetical protein
MSTWSRIAGAVSCLLFVAQADAAQESCVTCHPDVRTEYEQGVHYEQFGCTGCHGGDPMALDASAHAKEKGYVGAAGRLQIPALCGGCHSDAARMRPFGIPTDQYARYQTSEHGIRLAKGDDRVAVCTDCHGVHRILAPTEPTSPVAPANIPATCGHCHSNKALMDEYKLPSNQQEQYRSSVHGIALLVEERRDAPTCATCHGVHGAAVSAGQDIGTVCGSCHVRSLEAFNQGPHRAATAAGTMSECASCHGNHGIVHPTQALFDNACRACHQPDDAALSTAAQLKTLFNQANESLDAADGDLAQVSRKFPTVVRYRHRLEQAQAYFIEAMTVQHALAVSKVEDLTRSARSISEEVRSSVHSIAAGQQLRYLGLAVFWVFLLFVVGVAYLYKREQRGQR